MKWTAVTVVFFLTSLFAQAATLNWAGVTGDYSTAANWSPAQVPTSADDAYFSNGGTAVISGGGQVAGKLYLGQAASGSGNLILSNGNLTVFTAAYIANAAGSTGGVTMTGSSTLTAGNIQVGVRGTATMSVGSSAEVTSATLFLASVSGSRGTLDLAGTWNAAKVTFSNTAGDSRLNLNGGHLDVSGDFDMDNSTYPSRLTVNGSAGSFSAKNFYAASGGQTLDFIADAAGFTTLNVNTSIDITGATLNINLDAYEEELAAPLVLMNGASLSGTFAGVNIIAGGATSLIYDRMNGDLLLSSEPAATSGLFFSLTGVVAPADHLQVPPVFADHMVLQRETNVPVWGSADAGTTVTVDFSGQKKTATADADGRWELQLDALQASAEPRTMVVSSPGSRIELTDVLVGEVWLCSGQSNMYRPIGGIPGVENSAVEGCEEVLALPENPNIRLFCDDGHPLWNAMKWQRARSETLNLFSAVGYFFGKKISDDLNVPVGLMLVSRVGTTIQAWTPKEHALQAPVTAEYRALYEANIDEIRAYNQAPAPKPALSDELLVARTFATVGGLYNNWLAAQVPFAIRGALWYQGESNGTWEPTARHYDDMLRALAAGLRAVWNRPEMPFYFVQLPVWDGATSEYWPWIRQSMLNADLSMTNSGMAVTVDVGDPGNLHPAKKQPVGERLALLALNNTYNRLCVYSGPLPSGAVSESGGVRVQFNTFGSALTVSGGNWIEIEAAGTNGVFYPATATVGISNALISCSQVADPVTIRYGWKSTFTPTLFNTNGLPASPFCFVRDAGGSWRLCSGDDSL